MKRFLTAVLCVAPLLLHAQDAPPASAPDKAVLAQAYDGAMTCSALAALETDSVPADERWLWENRTLAFGILAAHFWNDAHPEPITDKAMDESLNQYTGGLSGMPPDQVAPFMTACAGKFDYVDKFCEANRCVHEISVQSPPAQPESPAHGAE